VAATWAPGTPGHTWQVVAQGKGDIAHKMMLWSAKVIGLSAIRILQNPSSLKAVKEEFQETMQTPGVPSASPLRSNHALWRTWFREKKNRPVRYMPHRPVPHKS
jgi:hypothetical protein